MSTHGKRNEHKAQTKQRQRSVTKLLQHLANWAH